MPKSGDDFEASASDFFEMELADAEASYKVIDSALDELGRRGIRPDHNRPEANTFTNEDGYPQLPNNLVDLSDRDIGYLYSTTQNYVTYISQQYTEYKGRLEEAKAFRNFLSSKVKIAKDTSIKLIESHKAIDGRYVKADAEVLKLQYITDMLDDMRKSLNGNLRVISRTIAVREQTLAGDIRGASIESRRAINRSFNPRSPRPSPGRRVVEFEDKEVPREHRRIKEPKKTPVSARVPTRRRPKR